MTQSKPSEQFQPLTVAELIEILGLTIKQDRDNKLATFLAMLSAFSENAQLNVSFNAPSSTGKSYIPLEIAQLFPQDSVIEIGYSSPTAFFHDHGVPDEEKGHVIDLERKILIFLDQPHNDLQARLRPILSHDKKEILLKITDKTQKLGLRTKNVVVRGFPVVIFCTAKLGMDEQEATRFLLLSPETSQQKLRESVTATIHKEADPASFKKWLEEDPKRARLMERIAAIRDERIDEVNIADCSQIEAKFLDQNKKLKPRHQRDVKRLMSIVKALALLNVWHRKREGAVITASTDDVTEALKLWEEISVAQDLNLPPYVLNLYNQVILPAYREKNPGGETQVGITRQQVLAKHYELFGGMLDGTHLRQQILPMLETAGLIVQEPDPNGDRRKMLIYPTPSGNGKNGESARVPDKTMPPSAKTNDGSEDQQPLINVTNPFE